MFKFLNNFCEPKKLRTYLGSVGQWHVDQRAMRRYYIIHIANSKQFNPVMSNNEKSDGTIDELATWCRDNDCSYGWDRTFYREDTKTWESTDGFIGMQNLFIITRDEETATLAKLVWCGENS